MKQNGVGKRLQEIQNAYMALWSRFTEAAAMDHLTAKADNDTYGSLLKRGPPSTAEALFVLPAWPYKASSSKSVDIVVQVVEELNSELTAITKCTTQIGYYTKRGASTGHKRILEMHYDFETPVCEAHPIFHAQIGDTKWPEGKLSALGLPLSPQSAAGSEAGSYGKARIPTAFVGFSQILTVLAADHLKPKAYREVIEQARIVHPQLPSASCEELLREVVANTFPAAHHWYEHRYAASVTRLSSKGEWKATLPLLGLEARGDTEDAARSALVAQSRLRLDQIKFSTSGSGSGG